MSQDTDALREQIEQQCAHYGGLIGAERCLLNTRNWAPGIVPTRCKLCPDAAHPVQSPMRQDSDALREVIRAYLSAADAVEEQDTRPSLYPEEGSFARMADRLLASRIAARAKLDAALNPTGDA